VTAVNSQDFEIGPLMRRLGLFAIIAFGAALCATMSNRSTTRADEKPAPAPAVRLTRDGGFKQHLQWSPDGKRFLMTRIHEGKMALWTMNVDGSDLKALLSPPPDTPHFDGHWSPDGKKIVFVLDILQGTDGKLQINTVNADGTDSKLLIPHKSFEESPRWSPDGKRIAWVSSRHGNQEIYSVDLDSKDINNPQRLTNDIALDNNPAWSPDGKKIAFASGRSGNFEIHVMDADGSNVRRLTNHPAVDYWPAWSPDGKRIAFTSNRDGNYEIYVMNADGTGLVNATRHPGQDNYATWSPDGKKIAFISNRDGGHDVYVVDAP
jgi:TolB protein